MNLEKELPKGAPVVMRQRGEHTDNLVIHMILEKPGSTVHEIAENLGWTNGRVDGSVNRLLKEGRIRVQHCIRRGMLIKKVYPMEEEARTPNTIEIPKEMIAEDMWKDTVRVYSLSRSSIAISATKIEEWEKKAFWKRDIHARANEKKLIVRLPDHLSDFYRLENSETSLSTSDEFALVTVESIVPVDLPPTFPARPVYKRRHIRVVNSVVDIIEEVPSDQVTEFYGEYVEGEERPIQILGVSEAKTSTLNQPKKRVSSDTSQSIEMPIEAVVGK